MERHSVDESAAFDMLRGHSRSTNRKLVDIAAAVVDGHRLLPKTGEIVAAGDKAVAGWLLVGPLSEARAERYRACLVDPLSGGRHPGQREARGTADRAYRGATGLPESGSS